MSKSLLVTGAAGFIGANFVHYWARAHPTDTLVAYDALTYAGNIANLGTPGYRRQEVTQTTAPEGGVTTQLQRAAAAGEALEADVVAQLQAKNAYLANLAVFKAADKMAGVLLDKTA